MEWSRSIRVLLAVLVASWFPALCCCRAPGPSEQSASEEHLALSTSANHYEVCDSDQPSGADPCHDSVPGDDHCGCQRHDLQTVPPTVDEAPALGVLHHLLVLNAAIPTGAVDFDLALTEQRLRRCGPASPGAVRAETLYERRCLLLI